MKSTLIMCFSSILLLLIILVQSNDASPLPTKIVDNLGAHDNARPISIVERRDVGGNDLRRTASPYFYFDQDYEIDTGAAPNAAASSDNSVASSAALINSEGSLNNDSENIVPLIPKQATLAFFRSRSVDASEPSAPSRRIQRRSGGFNKRAAAMGVDLPDYILHINKGRNFDFSSFREKMQKSG